jgi:SAM-dependent methyltransferase
MTKTPPISLTGYWNGNEIIDHVCCIPICDWIEKKLDKNKILYDFGCGNGQYLSKLKSYGFNRLTGFEGDPPKQKDFNNIIKQDLSQPFSLQLKGNCLFLEVIEHIPVEYENTALDNIISACDNILVMSWAVVGQTGWGHVNCVSNETAINKITNRGMKFLESETNEIRNMISDDNPYPWFKNTTLIFRKI